MAFWVLVQQRLIKEKETKGRAQEKRRRLVAGLEKHCLIGLPAREIPEILELLGKRKTEGTT